VDDSWLSLNELENCQHIELLHFRTRALNTAKSDRRIPNLTKNNITISFYWNGHPSLCQSYGPALEMIQDEQWRNHALAHLQFDTMPCNASSNPNSFRTIDGKRCGSRRPIDILVTGVGLHYIPDPRGMRFPHKGAEDRYRRLVQEWANETRRLANRVVWKDITPGIITAMGSFEAPYVERFHQISREVISSLNELSVQNRSDSFRLDIWPIHHVLSYQKTVEKPGRDFHHCSQMHFEVFNSTEEEKKNLDVRTPECAMAVQILLNILCT
jgi:hypothetical protein